MQLDATIKSSQKGHGQTVKDEKQLKKLSSRLFFIAHRYGHHASRSGYDRFADYLGTRIVASRLMERAGETVLKVPAKMIEASSGIHEYRRHDVLLEMTVLSHLMRGRKSIYHFLYAEKSLFLISYLNGFRGHRIVGSFHHCQDSYPKRYRKTKFLQHLEHAVVVSRRQIEFVESLVGPGKVTFVPYAVDAQYFCPSPKSLSRRPRCTCAGEHLRDFETLRSIITRVAELRPDVEFYVIGAPVGLETEFRSIPTVVWKRRIADEEYLEILRQTDVLVLPLHDSTSVTSVNEALACGVPVVTSTGGVEDYLTIECSFLHKPGDADGMVFSTIRLLEDDLLRFNMGAAARRHALSLDWPISAAKMLNVYRQLVE